MSRFLPDDFDANRPLALIAGQGSYPIRWPNEPQSGIPLRLIELSANLPELVSSFSDDDRTTVKVGQVGKLPKSLKVRCRLCGDGG